MHDQKFKLSTEKGAMMRNIESTTQHKAGLLIYLISLIILSFLLSFFLFINYQLYFPFPFWDGVPAWLFISQDYSNYYEFLKGALQFVDNEHKPIIPLGLMKLDYIIFSGPGYFIFTINILIILCISAFLASGSDVYYRSMKIKLISFLATLILLTSPMHFENILWWKQLHVYLSLFFSFSCIFILSSSMRIKSNIRVILALIIGFLSSFCFGYGLAIIPIIGFYILTRQKSLLYFCLWLFAVFVIFILYNENNLWQILQGREKTANTIGKNLAANLFSIYSYSSHLLVMPISYAEYVLTNKISIFSTVFGSFVIFIGIYGTIYFTLVENRSSNIYLYGLQFAIICAFMTAVTRHEMNLPLASRYFIITCIALICSVNLLIYFLQQIFEKQGSFVRLHYAVSFTLAALAIVTSYAGIPAMSKNYERVQRGGLTAELGQSGDFDLLLPATSGKIDDVFWPRFIGHSKRKGRLLAFGRTGETISESFPEGFSSCSGGLTLTAQVRLSPRMIEFNGSLIGDWGKTPENILVADSSGVLLGIGSFSPVITKYLSPKAPEILIYYLYEDDFGASQNLHGEVGLEFFAFSNDSICKLLVQNDI